MGISRAYVFYGWNYASILLTPLLVKANILIDRTGHACLADFGLITIVSDHTSLLSSSSHTHGGTARWMSPELIDPPQFGFKNNRPTKHSDCYALGMVIYETISGHLPFHQHGAMAVFMKVLKGERPLRGVGFTQSLWKMLESCWRSQSNDRPSIENVLQCLDLEEHLKFSEPPYPGVDEEIEEDGDDLDLGGDSSGVGRDSFGMFSHIICNVSQSHHVPWP